MTRLPALIAVLTMCGCFLTPALPADEELLDGPHAALTEGQLAVFIRGDEGFNRQFRREDGLGPVFNATSCATCHPGDGRGHPEFGFLRFGREIDGGFDAMIEAGGPQLQDRAVAGASPETLPADATSVTLMLAPPVTGLGLLEAIPDADLLERADPDDEDGDGISGRVHWRTPTDDLRQIAEIGSSFGPHVVEYADGYIGRFGRRGSNISLLHQAVSAYHQDIGITSDFAPIDLSSAEGVGAHDAVPDPELGSGELADVVFYLRTLRAPARRSPGERDVRTGEELFEAIGCADCHVPTWRTGRSPIEALDDVEFHPYTDLLLHDMGPALADGYAEHGSTVGEWRTAPLWGLGLAAEFTGGTLFLMHDGRARSIAEAIELHGGEGGQSRSAWRALSTTERAQLERFMESL